MISIFPNDTQWAIASNVETDLLQRLVFQLPDELQGNGSRVVVGTDGFAALLVFGGVPSETLAKSLLASATPVYLMDFDDEAPIILKFDRRKTRVTETRITEHPADFLEEHGITPPGYEPLTTPVKEAGVIEGASVDEVKRALPSEMRDVEPRSHARGVLLDNAIIAMIAADRLDKRAYLVSYDPTDGWFSCVVHEPGKERSAFSLGEPDVNAIPLDNILGETTREGIMRVLEIPGELLGL